MKQSALLLLLLFAFNATQAQDQDERIQRILEEKFHLDKFNVISGNNSSYKTTGNDESKISNVVSPSIEESEGFIAINPTDSNKMVLSFMEFSTQLVFPVYFTNDGGQTWTKSAFNSTDIVTQEYPNGLIGGGGDPVFAYDKTGKLYFSFIYLILDFSSSLGYFNMYWASSTDNGLTFQFEQGEDHFVGFGGLNLGTGGIDDTLGHGVYDRQWMAVDNTGGPYDGRLYLSTLFVPNDSTNRIGDGTILMYKDKDSARFSSSQTQISIVPDGQFGNVAVASNGDVHVTYADYDNNRVYHRKSTDGGQTFGTQNLIYEGFGLFGGEPIKVVHERENSAPTMVVGSDGTIHIAWADYANDTAFSFYSRSTNDGSTWSTPLRMRNVLPGFKDHFMPHVAVDKSGNPSISWYSVKPNGNSMFYNVQSYDGGATFLAPAIVSSDSTDYSIYGQTNFFGDYCNSVKLDCKTFTLWSDGRQSLGPKMYVGTVDHCGSISVPELTPLTSTVQLQRLFPNPASAFVSLELESEEAFQSTIQIIDLNGKCLRKKNVDVGLGKQVIELELDLSSGTYILEISTPDNARITRKLSVE